MQVALRKSAPKPVKQIINILLNYAKKRASGICRETNINQRVKYFNAHNKHKRYRSNQTKTNNLIGSENSYRVADDFHHLNPAAVVCRHAHVDAPHPAVAV